MTRPRAAGAGTKLLELVDAALDALHVREETVLAAVSGGIDSVVLLDALCALAPSRGLRIAVATVDHGLRGTASAGDAAFVEALAAARSLPFAREQVDPETARRGLTGRRRPTLQEAARRARYDALDRAAAQLGATRIATAHQMDDQAETVLLRLLRGTGPDGLGGIPEASPDGRIIRPMLGVSREAVESHARERGLAWREDPSNRSPRYARSRLRHRWLPGLAREFNPRLLRSVAHLAEAHRRDAEWIGELVEAEAHTRLRCRGQAWVIDRTGWEELPTALARRLVHHCWRQVGGGREITRDHLARACAFLATARPGAVLELPGGLELAAGRGEARLRRTGVERGGPC